MAEPLRILPPPNADTQKHGRRYAAQDRETAFVTYRAVRSLRETAKRTGVTVSTDGMDRYAPASANAWPMTRTSAPAWYVA